MASPQTRRRFLRDGLLLSSGVAIGSVLPSSIQRLEPRVLAQPAQSDTSPEQRLKDRRIELPPPPTPVAVYVPAVQVGEMVYVSGHGPPRGDGQLSQGKVGNELTLQQGYNAARLVGLNVLSTLRNTVGSLDRVVRLVKVLGMVNCPPEFTQQPQVINGFSELMVEVFGESAGKGARSAVGVGSLPGNIPVEIEAIFQVRS
jgi:enamine deaminase RidA (YjgF/YER057c/UK114 family)